MNHTIEFMIEDKPSKTCIPGCVAAQMVDDYMDEVDEKHRKIPNNWKNILWKCKCGSEIFEEGPDWIKCLRCGHKHQVACL
jgi:hypothetical protein